MHGGNADLMATYTTTLHHTAPHRATLRRATVTHDHRPPPGQPLIGATARRTLRVHRHLLVAMSGLDGDVLTFSDDLAAHLRLLRLQEAGVSEVAVGAAGGTGSGGSEGGEGGGEGAAGGVVGNDYYSQRRIAPPSLAKLVSTKLYAQRQSPFYVEPVIAGITSDGDPYLWSSDGLGAPMTSDTFVVAGSCSASLAGICEAL